MELIAFMIQNTKRRITARDFRISGFWCLLTIIVGEVAWALISWTHNPWFNFIWLAIPVIGIPINFLSLYNRKRENTTKTYIDTVSERLWKTIMYIAVGLIIGCFIAQVCGFPQAWNVMFYYAFIIIGFGTTVSGLLLHENSFIFGGLFSIFSGFAIIICTLCDVVLDYSWVMPLYFTSFLLMFILPAIIISRKIKNGER